MEMLTEEEVAVVAGSWGSGWTVTGQRWDDFREYLHELLNEPYSGGGGGTGGGGTTSTGGPDTNDPNCATTNPILGLTPPDNARYLLPEDVTGDDLIDMLNHLSNFAATHSAYQLLDEFKAMYENPAHPFFMDFKDWGGAGGPAGSESGGTTTYFSEAAGAQVTGSVFEAFGNFWYGFAGTWAGISPDALYGAAALMQEGNTGWIPQDGPEDSPHVTAGITAALKYKVDHESAFTVNLQSCGAAGVLQALGGPRLDHFTDTGAIFGEEAYAADLLSWVQSGFYDYVQSF